MRKMEKYGTWALVTGASSGIGRAFAEEFVTQGINCVILSNDLERLKETKSVLQQLNPEVEIVEANINLADVNSLRSFLATPLCERVGIVVNCAGIGMMGCAINFKADDCINLFNINNVSPFVITHHFTRSFYDKKISGAIINISSVNTELKSPIPYSSVYTSGKVFMKFFTEALSQEMRDFPIDILNVSCGPTATNFQSVANTKQLSWCETPEHVVTVALKKLGKSSSVITHPISNILIHVFRYLPLPRSTKMKLLGYFFGKVLGQGRNISAR